MQIISHRANTIDQLSSTPEPYGAEVDVRYHENDLILHHDPFHHHEGTKPQKFDAYLAKYTLEGPLILNIKTEGVEQKCIDLMVKHNIKNWFFLDLSMPYFVLYSQHAYNKRVDGFSSDNLAVRFSEYEPIEYALSFAGMANWIWVDCFTKMPLNRENYSRLKSHFKICLVSPELQKRSVDEILLYKQQLEKMPVDAVCTKRPDLWVK